MNYFLRLGLSGGIALAFALLVMNHAATAAAEDAPTVMGTPHFDPTRGVILVPFKGPVPAYPRHMLSATRYYFDFGAARPGFHGVIQGHGAALITRFTMAAHPSDHVVRLAFQTSVQAVPTITLASPHEFVVSFSSPAQKSADVHTRALATDGLTLLEVPSFDTVNGQLLLSYTGAEPNFHMQSIGSGKLAIDVPHARIHPGTPTTGKLPSGIRYRFETIPKGVRLVLEDLPQSATAASRSQTRMTIASETPAPKTSQAPVAAAGDVKTIFSTGTFDAVHNRLVLPYFGRSPIYTIQRPSATTRTIEFPHAALYPDVAQTAPVEQDPIVSSWLLAQQADGLNVRLTLQMPYGGNVQMHDDRDARQLVIEPVLGESSPATPAPGAAPSVGPSTAPAARPTAPPSAVPTAVPAVAPTTAPSSAPSASPTIAPTASPSLAPQTAPTPHAIQGA